MSIHHPPGAVAVLPHIATRFDPHARSFEAFACGATTSLLQPLNATSLKNALAETTSRWSWDRGSRLAVREIGEKVDLLHVYAVRRASQPRYVRRVGGGRDYDRVAEAERWLDHICTVDLNIVAGIDLWGVGVERDLHERRQQQRPEGARLGR